MQRIVHIFRLIYQKLLDLNVCFKDPENPGSLEQKECQLIQLGSFVKEMTHWKLFPILNAAEQVFLSVSELQAGSRQLRFEYKKTGSRGSHECCCRHQDIVERIQQVLDSIADVITATHKRHMMAQASKSGLE